MCRQCLPKTRGGRPDVDANRHGQRAQRDDLPGGGSNPEMNCWMDGDRSHHQSKCVEQPGLYELTAEVQHRGDGLPGQLPAYRDARYPLVPAYHDLGRQMFCYNVLVGGKLSSGGYRIASSLDMYRGSSFEAFDVYRTPLLHIYRDHGSSENRPQSTPRYFWSTPGARPGSGMRWSGMAVPTDGWSGCQGGGRARSTSAFFAKATWLELYRQKVLVGQDQSGRRAQHRRAGRSLRDGEVRLSPGRPS